MITEQNFNKLIQDILNPETRGQALQEYDNQKSKVAQYILENPPEPSDYEHVLELPTGVEVRPSDEIAILHNGEWKVATYVGLVPDTKADTMKHAVCIAEQPYWVCDYMGADSNGYERMTWEHRDTGALVEVELVG